MPSVIHGEPVGATIALRSPVGDRGARLTLRQTPIFRDRYILTSAPLAPDVSQTPWTTDWAVWVVGMCGLERAQWGGLAERVV